jgi:hypothetical protein
MEAALLMLALEVAVKAATAAAANPQQRCGWYMNASRSLWRLDFKVRSCRGFQA